MAANYISEGFTDNPFWLTTDIPDRYFCDREKETEDIIRFLRNRNNVVLKADRRVGKTSLLHHIAGQKEIRDNFNVYFIDIWATKNSTDLIKSMAETIGEKAITKREQSLISQIVNALNFTFWQDNISGAVKTSVNLNGRIGYSAEATLKQIFDYLESTTKPNIVFFDEFQQIKKYEDGDATALLRSKIQHCNNSVFVYSGSESHMLELMFNSASEPFFRSSSDKVLHKIPVETYTAFAVKMFNMKGKSIEAIAVDKLYSYTYGYTSSLNKYLNRAFSFTGPGERCSLEVISRAIEQNLLETDIENKLRRYNTSDIAVLTAIASTHGASHLLSEASISGFNLGTTSKVQTSLKKLLKDGLVIRLESNDSEYCLSDSDVEAWIRLKFLKQSVLEQLQ